MAAGLGFKTFTTGEVLTAADTNGYLMQGVLVFASSAARAAAITSPQEGQYSYLKDTDTTQYYSGSAWVTSGGSGMTNPMTTTGDTIYASSGSTPARLGIGSTGQVLTVAGGIPSWATPSGGSPFASDISVNSITVGRGSGNISNNTVLGNGALAANTSGTQNTAIGAGSVMYLNTTGAYNTAVGSAALQTTATAVHCTAVGKEALRDSTGDTNTAVGSQAGQTMATGTNNSFLGYNSAAASTSTSNSITLGNANITSLRCAVTSITSISDKRDKKNIEPLEVGLDFVNGLKPVTFDWNMRPTLDADGNEIAGKVDMPDAGFIAQDFVAAEDAIGLADHLQLSFRDNPDKLEISQGRLIPILVKAIQDLSAKVEALEAAQ